MNDDKKQLLKIRLRKDGKWEHVYSDGSVDQEFHTLTAGELAGLYTKRDKMMQEYAKLDEMAADFIEQALEYSNYSDAKSVIDYIRKK